VGLLGSAVFYGDHMNLLVPYEELERVCVRYRQTGSKDLRASEDVTLYLEEKARKNFRVPDGSRVAAVLDATVWKSLDYGCAICEDGLFWTNAPGVRTRRNSFEWDELLPMALSRSGFLSSLMGTTIDFGEGSVLDNAWSDCPTAALLELLQVLQVIACRYVRKSSLPESQGVGGLRIDAAGWSLLLNGVVVSGLDASVIHSLVREEDVNPQLVMAWRSGMKEWQTIASLSQLQPRMTVAPPPPQPGKAVQPSVKVAATKSIGWGVGDLFAKARTALGMENNLIDVNSASREDLAKLPFMSGRRIAIIEKRQKEGRGFFSIEEVAAACALKPHESENLRPLIAFGGTRVTENKAGARLVDF